MEALQKLDHYCALVDFCAVILRFTVSTEKVVYYPKQMVSKYTDTFLGLTNPSLGLVSWPCTITLDRKFWEMKMKRFQLGLLV